MILAIIALTLACITLPVSIIALREARAQLAYAEQKMAEHEAQKRLP